MRTLTMITGMFAAVAMIVTDAPCSAQQPSSSYEASSGLTSPSRPNRTRPQRKPTVSPYLNLFRPGASPGANYNTLVRPQLEQQARNRQQDTAIRNLSNRQQQISNLISPFGRSVPNAQAPTTGHPTQFGNLGSYFGTR